ncbi:hypothetical protein [Silvanigrella aquatica]|uniref:Outer membrane protein beta-barrel domain-containing protein n=1 Tax=Silvanigrella aquatica TaxID=1915309 RepID=A0A1L4D3V7_9BACT|nr:hypothetical protein [Silvanigrella aquatica]APJ04869.1 hypothetical protein AXG55_13595 [Silvanigrella aquatica]
MKIWIFLIILLNPLLLYAENNESSKNNTLLNSKQEHGFWEGEWYISWGYNKDYWKPSDIHVSQPALGNDFTIHNVVAEDFPMWNTGLFNKDLTDPEYSIRLGHFIDKERSIALELNYDHTKYSSNLDQSARVTGIINGSYVDSYQTLSNDYFHYNLHNGANHIMINIVKRLPLFGELNQTFSMAGLIKVGAGIMLPHAENRIMGNDNNVGTKKLGNYIGTKSGWWQLNGWTVGVEGGLRYIVWNPIYLEFAVKEAYARLYNVPVYMGTAQQTLWMTELILSLGYTFDSLSKD